jgi:hypothetical protein
MRTALLLFLSSFSFFPQFFFSLKSASLSTTSQLSRLHRHQLTTGHTPHTQSIRPSINWIGWLMSPLMDTGIVDEWMDLEHVGIH